MALNARPPVPHQLSTSFYLDQREHKEHVHDQEEPLPQQSQADFLGAAIRPDQSLPHRHRQNKLRPGVGASAAKVTYFINDSDGYIYT